MVMQFLPKAVREHFNRSNFEKRKKKKKKVHFPGDGGRFHFINAFKT